MGASWSLAVGGESCVVSVTLPKRPEVMHSSCRGVRLDVNVCKRQECRQVKDEDGSQRNRNRNPKRAKEAHRKLLFDET